MDVTDSQRATTIVPLVAAGKSAFGICMASSRIFYTDGASSVFSIRTNGGGTHVEVSTGLNTARGCAYDGDGTIFVADSGAGKVYSFSGGAADMSARPLSLALDMPGAYGLAVMSSLA